MWPTTKSQKCSRRKLISLPAVARLSTVAIPACGSVMKLAYVQTVGTVVDRPGLARANQKGLSNPYMDHGLDKPPAECSPVPYRIHMYSRSLISMPRLAGQRIKSSQRTKVLDGIPIAEYTVSQNRYSTALHPFPEFAVHLWRVR